MDTLTNQDGCDSISVLDLTVLPIARTSVFDTICKGDVYDFNGRIISSAGTFFDTQTGANTCDSIITLFLAVSSDAFSTIDTTICQGGSIFFNDEDAIFYFILVLGLILGLFVIVPTLNLININVTRIMERSSEIGVRKAFGAKSTDLLVQFIFENIILTFIGGLIGLVLALVMMKVLNDSQVIAPVRLVFYPSAFGFSILVWFVFGIASGLLPALRMSRLHVVTALKRNEL